MAVGRNAPCPCGSGKKYKRCCALKTGKSTLGGRMAIWVVGLMLLTGAVVMLLSLGHLNDTPAHAVNIVSDGQ
jgi:hypothetical protein